MVKALAIITAFFLSAVAASVISEGVNVEARQPAALVGATQAHTLHRRTKIVPTGGKGRNPLHVPAANSPEAVREKQKENVAKAAAQKGRERTDRLNREAQRTADARKNVIAEMKDKQNREKLFGKRK
ncbi:hypothetical protein BC829DRAFT_446153 [Chytridium lagenaria]|nr:hypothetical protein BC829DRAFT_446153 [Chytridium lagenaria]